MDIEISELSRQPLHRQVARQIRTRILGREIDEHADLTPVRELARQQRVSVACIERAYRELESQGLVERTAREHYRVATLDDEQKRELERQRLLEDLRRQEFSLRELELARDIQCRLLPPPSLSGKGWRVESRSEAARFVAGDFHDVIRFPDGSIAIVVADVVGKGIGASLIMASVKAMLPFVALEHDPEETIRELNTRLCGSLAKREFVALALAHYTPWTRLLTLVNAGLPDPALVPRGGSHQDLVAPGERLPLGLRRRCTWTGIRRTLEPGDRLLLTTDGIPEAMEPNGDPIGYAGWSRIIEESRQSDGGTSGEWLDGLLGQLRDRTSPHLEDDLTAVVLEAA